MPQYFKTSIIVAFTFGILVTLGFENFYPDPDQSFRRWRRGRKLQYHEEDISARRNHIYMHDGEAPGGFQKEEAQDIVEQHDRSDLRLPLKRNVKEGIEGTIGDTPLIRIKSLSNLIGVDILAKCEFLNGAGNSPKDRVALSIIGNAEREGLLTPHSGDTIYEGTVGSTGISLATICRARGYYAHVCMPSDQSIEKRSLLKKLGATVSLNDPISIVDPSHYVNRARRLAEEHTAQHRNPVVDPTPAIKQEEIPEASGIPTGGLTHNNTNTAGSLLRDATSPTDPINSNDTNIDTGVTASILKGDMEPTSRPSRGFFANQFETPFNHLAHLHSTGPEIFAQTGGHINAFVAGAGTGGTISGVALFLKPRLPTCHIILADPQGSGLYNKVQHGVMFSGTEKEGTRRRHQVDSVVEGIGCNRVTANFEVAYAKGLIDGAVRVSDAQARRMARWLVAKDGIFVGSSSAVNVVGAVVTARRLLEAERIEDARVEEAGRKNGGREVDDLWSEEKEKEKKTVVTILCDSGMRHLSRFWADTEEIGGDSGDDLTLDDVLRDD